MRFNRLLYAVLIILWLVCIPFLSFAGVHTNWGNFPKRIVGNASPVINIAPYTIMTQRAGAWWHYSCQYIPGQTVTIKFLVNTNLATTNFLMELAAPKEITITFGTQGNTYYITNDVLGLIRVTESTQTNGFMRMEFNWEDRPDEPTGLASDTAELYQGRCHLSWSASRELDVIGYNVYISNKKYPNYRKINKNIIMSNYYSVSNIPFGTTNTIYVTSIDAYTNMPNNESGPSSSIQVIVDRYIKVQFYVKKRREDVSDAIYIGGNRQPLNWDPSQKMTYLDNDIWYYTAKFIVGTALQYKYNMNRDPNGWEGDFATFSKNREIVVTDPDGDGIMSLSDIWGIESIQNPPPSAPSNIIAVSGNSNISLFWKPNHEMDLQAYRIYRSLHNTNRFSLVQSVVTTNFFDSPVFNGTNYFYRVTAVDLNNGESGISETIQVTPSTNPAPVRPQGLYATGGNTNVNLFWNPNPETDIQGYVVWRALQKYSAYSNISSLVTTNYFKDTFVLNDIIYYYKIQAVDTINQTNGGFSDIVQVTPSTNPAPVRPAGFELVMTIDSGIIISWNSNPESDIAGYRIYYKKDTGIINEESALSNITMFTIRDLDNGDKYSVWIKALDSSGFLSESSDILTAYPVPQITDLAVRPSGTETGAVQISFSSPDEAGDLGYPKRYIIKYSTNQVMTYNDFQKATLFSERQASSSGSMEFVKVNNLGTDCPGYYFTVIAIYGEDQGMGMSDSLYNVASMVLSTGTGGTFRKKAERIKVVIPPDILPQESSAIVIKTYTDLMKENSFLLGDVRTANEKANNYRSIKLTDNNTNLLFDITLLHSGGEAIFNKYNLPGDVTVYLPFNDSNHDQIIDETEISDPLSVNLLKMYWLNTSLSEWAFIERSQIDHVNNFVIAYINHMSVFANLATLPAGDLKNVAVYPNPAYSPSDTSWIVFTKLTASSKIRIYNLAAELVRKDLVADSTGRCYWNGLSDDGTPVASGLYIYYVEDGINEPVKGKLAIIR
ncbi:MAG: fibronectin type III domain-containing protein [Spirochaetes bacterium]|nr:fibronectin type III domain-containing protein [Spirochaetota bacterium]